MGPLPRFSEKSPESRTVVSPLLLGLMSPEAQPSECIIERWFLKLFLVILNIYKLWYVYTLCIYIRYHICRIYYSNMICWCILQHQSREINLVIVASHRHPVDPGSLSSHNSNVFLDSYHSLPQVPTSKKERYSQNKIPANNLVDGWNLLDHRFKPKRSPKIKLRIRKQQQKSHHRKNPVPRPWIVFSEVHGFLRKHQLDLVCRAHQVWNPRAFRKASKIHGIFLFIGDMGHTSSTGWNFPCSFMNFLGCTLKDWLLWMNFGGFLMCDSGCGRWLRILRMSCTCNTVQCAELLRGIWQFCPKTKFLCGAVTLSKHSVVFECVHIETDFNPIQEQYSRHWDKFSNDYRIQNHSCRHEKSLIIKYWWHIGGSVIQANQSFFSSCTWILLVCPQNILLNTPKSKEAESLRT